MKAILTSTKVLMNFAAGDKLNLLNNSSGHAAITNIEGKNLSFRLIKYKLSKLNYLCTILDRYIILLR